MSLKFVENGLLEYEKLIVRVLKANSETLGSIIEFRLNLNGSHKILPKNYKPARLEIRKSKKRDRSGKIKIKP